MPPVVKIDELAKKYKYFLFDCDGVLWFGSNHIGQAFRNIEKLEADGHKVFFITNLATISRKDMAAKMMSDTFKYDSVKPESCYPASTLAGLHVVQNMPDCKKVWMIGAQGLKDELENFGLEVKGYGLTDEEKKNSNFDNMQELISTLNDTEIDPEIKAVVQGSDYDINLKKISIASLYLQNGATWVVTNEDMHGKTMNGNRMPANGAMVNFLGTMLKKAGTDELICPKVLTGKPNPSCVRTIMKEHNIPESELSKFVMIGDNPGTDIALGNNAGIDTCLVLTGVVKTPEESVQYYEKQPLNKPT